MGCYGSQGPRSADAIHAQQAPATHSPSQEGPFMNCLCMQGALCAAQGLGLEEVVAARVTDA